MSSRGSPAGPRPSRRRRSSRSRTSTTARPARRGRRTARSSRWAADDRVPQARAEHRDDPRAHGRGARERGRRPSRHDPEHVDLRDRHVPLPVGQHVDRELQPADGDLLKQAYRSRVCDERLAGRSSALRGMTDWNPYLRGEQAEAALAVAGDLGDALAQQPASGDASLSRGEAGRALALAHLDRALPARGYGDASREALRQAIAAVARQPLGPGLMQGFTGVAWTIAHLADATAPGAADEALTGLLRRDAWRGGYDHVSGLVGVGVYALERGRAGAELLELVVARLGGRAECHNGTATWFTPKAELHPSVHERVPHGYYNLGMAHGVPGVAALLAGALDAGHEEAGPLLDATVTRIAGETLEDAPALWPFFVGREVQVVPARLAWCYGDPGVAVALLEAGRARGREDWIELAGRAIDKMAARAHDASGVTGASLCHGSAGLAHLCGRLHLATGRPELADMACHWIDRTLALRGHEDGLGGYSVWDPMDPDEVGGDVQGPGFLAGIAGVALALAAGASDRPPDWDRSLLVSLP